MNRSIINNQIQIVILKFPTNKSPGPDGFKDKFYLKVFQKTAEEGTLPNSFYKATITLIQKPGKDNTRKKTTGQYH